MSATKSSSAAAADDRASTIVNPLPPVMTRQSRDAWRRYLKLSRLPRIGCFTTKYPSTQWREVPCKKPRLLPYTVGAGNDWSATEPSIVSADGSFDPVNTVVATEFGVSTTGHSLSDTTGPNAFSLQLNSNPFTTPLCSGAKDPTKCHGVVQFLYSNQPNGGALFIQYQLTGFNASCPSGFTDDEPNCFQNSNGQAYPTPITNMSELAELSLSAAVSAKEDTATFTNGDVAWSMANPDLLGLSGKWSTVEFNVLGDSSRNMANFNSGAKIGVNVSVNNGSLAAPACIAQGVTLETNNLTLSSTPSIGTQPEPQVEFIEASSPVPPKSCAVAGGNAQDVGVVFRWYSPVSGDHFYTQDPTGELAPGVGYHLEGTPFSLFPAGTSGTTPFFRWYCPSNGHHFYTTDKNGELAKQIGCHQETTLGSIASSQLPGTEPLFRWYNSGNGDHFYTTDVHGELAVQAGYHFELVSGFVKQGP